MQMDENCSDLVGSMSQKYTLYSINISNYSVNVIFLNKADR